MRPNFAITWETTTTCRTKGWINGQRVSRLSTDFAIVTTWIRQCQQVRHRVMANGHPHQPAAAHLPSCRPALRPNQSMQLLWPWCQDRPVHRPNRTVYWHGSVSDSTVRCHQSALTVHLLGGGQKLIHRAGNLAWHLFFRQRFAQWLVGFAAVHHSHWFYHQRWADNTVQFGIGTTAVHHSLSRGSCFPAVGHWVSAILFHSSHGLCTLC